MDPLAPDANSNATITPAINPAAPSALVPPTEVTREHFLDWLRDAHAMEEQAETMMTTLAGRLEHYPQLKQRITLHIEETREQQRLLQTVLARYDTDTSTFKDMTGKVMATMHGMASMFASDEVLKGGWISYAFEHFEIATYTTLIAGAQALGDTESVAVFETILEQERAMGNWLAEHMSETTLTYLTLAAHADTATAKR